MYEEYLGCGSSTCYLQKPTGQATNGRCMCFDGLSTKGKLRLHKYIFNLKEEIKNLKED